MTAIVAPAADHRSRAAHFAEMAVLSVCLTDTDGLTVARDRLAPDDFADVRHRILFRAILAQEPHRLHGADILSVLRWLERHDELAAAGGSDYLGVELLDAAPTTVYVADHCTLILAESARRRISDVLASGHAAIAEGKTAEQVETLVERGLEAWRQRVRIGRVFDDKPAMAQAALDYLASDVPAGTPYGFHAWDTAALPVMQGQLILVGGASGSGKSTVTRNLIRQWVQRYDTPVGWLTCEMTGEEQLVALGCMDAGIALEDYYRRRLTAEDVQRFREAVEWWRDTGRLLVNEMGTVTPDAALRIFRRWRSLGVTHCVLDHLHRLDYGATKSGDDLRVPVAATAKALKNFAKDHEATVVALAQYSKIKPHEEPGDEKIRESNAILEEGDAVFHIWRPLVACERDNLGGLHPLVKLPGAGRYFEHDSQAPKDAALAHDPEYVYVKLGKQRRRIRDGFFRVPFNHRTQLMYDTRREPEF